MKTFFILIVGTLLLSVAVSADRVPAPGTGAVEPQNIVQVECTPDLYKLTGVWAGEYSRLHPGTKVKFTLPENGKLIAGEGISFVPASKLASVPPETGWRMPVARDIAVPVCNSGNPLMDKAVRQGVSPGAIAGLLKTPGEKCTWGELLGNSDTQPVHLYMANNELLKTTWSKFLRVQPASFSGILLETDADVISAVQKDPYAIGFCRMVDIVGTNSQGLTGNLALLPIDRNGNGKIDNAESIYSNTGDLVRGVWIGKYPRSLYNTIYAVSKSQPVDAGEIALMRWILTDGQQYLENIGFSDLAYTESQSQLARVTPEIVAVEPAHKAGTAGLILLIAALAVGLGVGIGYAVRRNRKETAPLPEFNDEMRGFGEDTVLIPHGLYYGKAHTWAFMEKDGTVTLGLDDFLQHVAGPITRIEMRNTGDRIRKGDVLFSIIQKGKQLKIYAPVSGTIKTRNDNLAENASGMNTSPYNDGWVYRLEPSNWFGEIQYLEIADRYKKWLSNEFTRLVDFLSTTRKPGTPQYAHIVMQDGGVLKDGVLADFGPEVWEDFQAGFLDVSK